MFGCKKCFVINICRCIFPSFSSKCLNNIFGCLLNLQINITDMFVQSDMSFMSVRMPDLGSGACVYLTAEYASGNYHLNLLMAKSRV